MNIKKTLGLRAGTGTVSCPYELRVMARVIAVLLIMSFTALCYSQFAGGSGTEADPYLIETAEHLNNVRDHLESQFRQTADIDLGVPPYNEGEGWEPIASAWGEFFTGSYDGNGHIISNLTINRPDSDRVGLFGQIRGRGVTIKKLGMEDVDITGNDYIGGFVGNILNYPQFNSCYLTGSVTGNNFVGGFAGGYYGSAAFFNCYITAAVVKGNNHIGGFFGGSEFFEVTNCYSAATVIATGTGDNIRIGGFVSHVPYPWTITNSFMMGSVITTEEIGYIGSYVSLSSPPSFMYPEGNTFIGNYRNYETTGITNSTTYGGGPYDLSEEAGIVSNRQMMRRETYPEWDFEDVWAIEEGETYPYLQWQGEPQEFNYSLNLPPTQYAAYLPDDDTIEVVWSHPSTGEPDSYNVYRDGLLLVSLEGNINSYEDNDVLNFERYRYNISAQYGDEESEFHSSLFVTPVPGGYSGGKGLSDDPYLIETEEHLNNIRFNAQAKYRQISDIDLSGFENWQPINTYGSESVNGFRGHYDGNGHTISGLNIESPETDYVGLFGIIGSAVVDRIPKLKNIRIVNSSVTGQSYVGIVAGAANSALIQNCYVEGNVTGSGSNIGGLLGYFEHGTVENSASVTTVSGGNNVGGFIGNVYTFMPLYSYRFFITEIKDSYSRGSINYQQGSDAESTGGFIGKLSFAKIKNCYSTVRLIFGQGFIGISGHPDNRIVENSYWDMQASSRFLSEGGEGRLTHLMVYPYGGNTYVDWDFEAVWAEDYTGLVKDGYPYLQAHLIVSPYPDIASNPNPADKEESVCISLESLSWQYPTNPFFVNPDGFRVYLNTTGEFDEEDEFEWVEYIEGEENYFCSDILPQQLEGLTTYYWKVVPTTMEQRADGRELRARGEEQTSNRHIDKSSNLFIRSDAHNVPVWSFTTIDPTNIEDSMVSCPYVTELHSNYPNPFNPETTISFTLAERGEAVLEVYNIRGQRVSKLVDDYLEKGEHQVIWNGKDDNDRQVGSGIYFYRMKSTDYTEVRKMIMVK